MKIEDILVPIDFSPGSLLALDYALAMVDPGGEVYLLHVVDDDFLARKGLEKAIYFLHFKFDREQHLVSFNSVLNE